MAAPMDPGEFRALATRLREEDRHDEPAASRGAAVVS
jgi:hypothetical protein